MEQNYAGQKIEDNILSLCNKQHSKNISFMFVIEDLKYKILERIQFDPNEVASVYSIFIFKIIYMDYT